MSASAAVPNTASGPVTLRVVSIVMFTFLCYLTIGLPLAILPTYVHLDLGYSSVLAGLVISVQYLATLVSRPQAGRMADHLGPKRTVIYGLCGNVISGVFLMGAAFTQQTPILSLALLFGSRCALGFAESCVGTGSIAWGIGSVGAHHTAKVISWNGVATYGALALGAPLGVALQKWAGFPLIAGVVMVLGVIGIVCAWPRPPAPIVHGEKLPFRSVLGRVYAYGAGWRWAPPALALSPPLSPCSMPASIGRMLPLR